MQPRAKVRLARALWIAWAVIVWNVVFDHVIVVAGRSYIHAAGSAAAGVILLTGMLTIRSGSKERPR